jgi:hypothetical protein
MALSPEREASSSCVRPAASRSRRNCVPNGAPCSGVSLRHFSIGHPTRIPAHGRASPRDADPSADSARQDPTALIQFKHIRSVLGVYLVQSPPPKQTGDAQSERANPGKGVESAWTSDRAATHVLGE